MKADKGLKRRVLRDEVVEYIVECIMRGDLLPGAKIIETKISRELQVSQGAVREAIRDLMARGFVETEAYKGSRVRKLTKTEMLDYYTVRYELEVLAVSWAFKNGSVNLAGLKNAIQVMEECTEKGDLMMVRRADVDFHRVIVEMAGSESLLRAWDALGNDYWIYMLTNIEFKELHTITNRVKKHSQILAAIEAEDLDLVRRLLENHFAHFNEFLN